MKILVVSDSFKGTLSSADIGRIVQEELSPIHPVDYFPVSDGGEGFLESMERAFPGTLRTLPGKDPLGRDLSCSYRMADGGIALIESARTCGIGLLSESERDPLMTSTFGLGLLIRDAIDRGINEIYIGLGGSATNDGGMGLLQALGARLTDERGREIHFEGGKDLAKIAGIDRSRLDPRLDRVLFHAVCDVTNPLLGANGATRVYGPQKGASPEAVETLEAGMVHLAGIVERLTGTDFSAGPGAGAAGGLGFCLRAFFGANLMKGTDALIALTGLEDLVAQYDRVITGEGRFDAQSESGKVPMGMLQLGQRHGVPVICLCGIDASERNPGFESIHAVVPRYATLDQSLENPEGYFRKLAREIRRIL